MTKLRKFASISQLATVVTVTTTTVNNFCSTNYGGLV